MQWLDEPLFAEWPRVAAFARAMARTAANDPAVWDRMGRMFVGFGKLDEADEMISAAVERLPHSIALRILLARIWTIKDKFEEALEQVELVLALKPGDGEAQLLRFRLLYMLGNKDRAAQYLDEVAGLYPFQTTLYSMWAHLAQNADGVEHLLRRCDAALAQRPAFSNAIYFKAMALAKAGDDDAARALISLDRHVQISELPVPADFEGGEAFRETLSAEIERNPTIVRNPRAKGTREGRRTRRLRQPDTPFVEVLIKQIKASVDAYVQQRALLPSDFMRGRPEIAHLEAWATIFGSDGFELSHHHPSGWLSGIYYVCAPTPQGHAAHSGALLLGALDIDRDGIDPPWGTLRIEPVPGRLVLFPSFIPHATEPTGIDDARISVAFDVIPVEAAQSARALQGSSIDLPLPTMVIH